MRTDDFKTFSEQCEKVKAAFNEINEKVRVIQERFRDAGFTDVCIYIDEIQKLEKSKLENVYLIIFHYNTRLLNYKF